MNINRQKEWRSLQIVVSNILKFDKDAQIEEQYESGYYDLLVTSSARGLKYGVEIKRSEFSRTKAYADYLSKLRQNQNDIDVPILLLSVNESSEEVKFGIVFSWLNMRPVLTQNILLWKSSQENWDKVLDLLSVSAQVEGPIEFLQLENLYLKKSLMLNVEMHDRPRCQAELVYVRKMSKDYKMNPRERVTPQDVMQFTLRGYESDEYPTDNLDKAIFYAVHDKFEKTTVNNQLIVFNTELRDLQVYRSYHRGQVFIKIAPNLVDMNEAVMRLLDGFTEFNLTIELYAHSVEDRDNFNFMDFACQEEADGWVEKVIEYRKELSSYKKLSDIID